MFPIDIDMHKAMLQERLQKAEEARKHRALIRQTRATQDQAMHTENDLRD